MTACLSFQAEGEEERHGNHAIAANTAALGHDVGQILRCLTLPHDVGKLLDAQRFEHAIVADQNSVWADLNRAIEV